MGANYVEINVRYQCQIKKDISTELVCKCTFKILMFYDKIKVWTKPNTTLCNQFNEIFKVKYLLYLDQIILYNLLIKPNNIINIKLK